MLGKTNIIFVTKNQNSEMQFVAEPIVTRSSSDIKKMKYLNGVFFAFTEEGSVLYGEDINNLSFLKIDGQLIVGFDIEYFEGKYVISYKKAGYGNMFFCVSEDLSTFINCSFPEENTSYKYKNILDIAVDSYNRLVFLTSASNTTSGTSCSFFDVYICDEPTDVNSFAKYRSKEYQFTIEKETLFMNDRFLCGVSDRSIKHCYCITLDAVIETIEENYYPIGIVNGMAYVSAGSNTYYSLNFKNYVKVKSSPITNCLLIGEQIGLYNEGTLDLASKVTDFSSGKSIEIDVEGIDYKVLCYVTTDEYTYLGCEGGIIIQCLLDVEGTYQTPEITLVKTLAAKEALKQAKEYADEKFAELKSYVDGLS